MFKKNRKRSFILKKLNIRLKLVSLEPVFSWPVNSSNPLLKFLAGIIEGQVFFNKKVYRHSFFDLLRYWHYQSVIGFCVFIGTVLSPLRFILPIFFPVSEKQISNKVKTKNYFLFPFLLRSVHYQNHLPIPFCCFQADPKTAATSFKDKQFAQKAIQKLNLDGFRALAWTSNYFLGYSKRIIFAKKTDLKKDLKKLLIATNASVPGFNQGLSEHRFFVEALNGKYSEESIGENEKAINFSRQKNSAISRPILITTNGNFKIISQEKSIQKMKQPDTAGIIYPIALLTNQNAQNPEWRKTPIKNISGFILGRKNRKPVCITLSSTSLIRIKVNRLLPYLQKICRQERIKFFGYIHTDDGGAVGDFYRSGKTVKKHAPVWGHCFSSLVGFAERKKAATTLKRLKHWHEKSR